MNAAKEQSERDCLLTVQQAAQQLAISKRTLERLIAARQFPLPLKIGRASRIAREDVMAFLEKLRAQRTAAVR
jgi:excisionase family DNA binding protein